MSRRSVCSTHQMQRQGMQKCWCRFNLLNTLRVPKGHFSTLCSNIAHTPQFCSFQHVWLLSSKYLTFYLLSSILELRYFIIRITEAIHKHASHAEALNYDIIEFTSIHNSLHLTLSTIIFQSITGAYALK